MLALWRDGYGREILALFIVTVLVASFCVAGVGTLVQRWFAESVESLVGVPGEYDVIVQLREEAGEQALLALRRQLDETAPGYRLKKGPTIVGRTNLFVGFPERHRTAETFESLEGALRDIPGFAGLTFIVEPAVLVKDVHPTVRDRFLAEATRVPEVLFGFEHNGNLWVVTERPSSAESVRRRLESIAGKLGILDIRLPVPVGPEELLEIERQTVGAAAEMYPDVAVTPVAHERSQTVRDLSEVKRLLTEIGGDRQEELRRALRQAEVAVSKAAADGSVRENISVVLNTFDQAVRQLEELERRALELSEQLKASAATDDAADVLVALLAEKLISGLQGEQGSEGAQTPERAVDIDQLKAGIAALSDRLVALESVDFETLLEGLRRLEESLEVVDADTEERLVELIDRVIQAQGGDGSRLEFLVEGGWTKIDGDAVAGAFQSASTQAYVRPAGVVEPDPRTVLSQLLSRAGDAVALLTGLLVTAVLFLLDASTLISYMKSASAGITGVSTSPRIAAAGAVAWGGAWMAGALSAVVWLGGSWDGVMYWAPLAGFAVGALLAGLSHRVSPVNPEELQAGLSLGLGNAHILREIVVPGSRPGLLIWLNNFGRRLPGVSRELVARQIDAELQIRSGGSSGR